MRIVEARDRPAPFCGPNTHARLRHDYAAWREDIDSRDTSRGSRLPYDHLSGGRRSTGVSRPGRSKFDSYSIVEDAIRRSVEFPAHVEDGFKSNFVVVFDMGHEVGFDAHARRRTSTVTIVLNEVGEVITVFPGSPWSGRWDKSQEIRSGK